MCDLRIVRKLYKKYIENEMFVYNKENDKIVIYNIADISKINKLEKCWSNLDIYKCIETKVKNIINMKNAYHIYLQVMKNNNQNKTEYKINKTYKKKCFRKIEHVERKKEKIVIYTIENKVLITSYNIDTGWGMWSSQIEGIKKTWYETINTQKIKYLNGKLNGKCINRGIYFNYNKDAQDSYLGSIEYFRDGKKHGLYMTFFESGALRTKQYYKNDLLHGEYCEMREKRNKKKLYNYNN